MNVDNFNACHGKLRHVDKDWRTVYGGLMVGCWRRLACVQPSCFCFCVSSQAEPQSGGSIHGSCQCVPPRGVSHDSCSRRRRWNTHDAPSGLNAAGAQRRQKLGGAEFFNEACTLERTVKNIVDVRRAQMEKLLTW